MSLLLSFASIWGSCIWEKAGLEKLIKKNHWSQLPLELPKIKLSYDPQLGSTPLSSGRARNYLQKLGSSLSTHFLSSPLFVRNVFHIK